MTARALAARHGATAVAIALCVTHFASFGPSRQPLVTDVRFFVYFAWRVAGGAVPHLDYFENKTQLASFAGALLYRLGELTGADPLLAIRWGYLGLAAGAGMAMYAIHRRLGGSAIAGGLGLLAYCSFGLLGLLPAIGNIPKLLMALGASLAALLLYRRSWFASGIVGALAFMDWQVGGLVGLGAVVTAAIHGSPRSRAVLRVVAGGLTGLGPFCVYYAYHGALGLATQQVIGSSLFRGTTTLAERGFGDRLAKIAKVVDLACPSQQALFYAGIAGIGIVAWWLWRWRDDERGRLLLPLSIYHAGVIAFSLIDFQYYGDFFLLLHSAAFFLGAVWVALYVWLSDRLGPHGTKVAGTLLLVIAFAAARPGVLRPRFELVTPIARPGVTLTDQQQVAAAIDRRLGDGDVLFLQHAELLFLMRRENALPLAYWNLPAWSYHRSSPQESFAQTGARLLFSVTADAVVPPKTLGYDALASRGYVPVAFASDNDAYSVRVAFKTSGAMRDAGPTGVTGDP